MKATASKELIEVDDLRVGMFVHLDMSWMSHPFPLGSFKIGNLEQIATIRSLGVQRVRWNPAQSDLPEPVVERKAGWTQPGALDHHEASAPAGSSIAESEGEAHEIDGATADAPLSATMSLDGPVYTATRTPVRDTAHGALHPAESRIANVYATSAFGGLHIAASSSAPVESPEVAARSLHKRKLAEQRAALILCERQFTEAAQGFKHMTEMVPHKPVEARQQAELLSKALVDKMLSAGDLCIRLLSDAAGDKAAMHALNVTIISLLMGRTFGLADSDMLDLGVGAMLHDIGKIDLPERVRHREDHFSGSEARFYEEHVAHGVGHARKMGLSPGATLVIAQHHEHADGTGFPLRLNTDRMTAASRIVSLVNRYDNLCNPNMASKALTPHESLSLLFAQGKTKFDTAILGAFIRMMGVYPAGSTVQLTDDRYALVVGVNSSRPLKPRVMVHEAKVPRDDALILDLEATTGLGIRRSIRPGQLPVKSLEYLSPRPRVAYFFEQAATADEEAIAA
jgi:putative nucleotidyltransferase with HDIG domain